MLISLVVLEHMGQKCEQGLAVLLPAPSPLAPVDLGGAQRRDLLQSSCFSMCVCTKLLIGTNSWGFTAVPWDAHPELPFPKHLCVSSVGET